MGSAHGDNTTTMSYLVPILVSHESILVDLCARLVTNPTLPNSHVLAWGFEVKHGVH